MFTIKALDCSILDSLITFLFFKTILTGVNKKGNSWSAAKSWSSEKIDKKLKFF